MARLFTLVGLVTLPDDAKVPDELRRIMVEGSRFGGGKTQYHFVTSISHCNAEPNGALNDLRSRFKQLGAISMTGQVIWGLDEVDNMIVGAPDWTDNFRWADENNDKNLHDICKNGR